MKYTLSCHINTRIVLDFSPITCLLLLLLRFDTKPMTYQLELLCQNVSPRQVVEHMPKNVTRNHHLGLEMDRSDLNFIWSGPST